MSIRAASQQPVERTLLRRVKRSFTVLERQLVASASNLPSARTRAPHDADRFDSWVGHSKGPPHPQLMDLMLHLMGADRPIEIMTRAHPTTPTLAAALGPDRTERFLRAMAGRDLDAHIRALESSTVAATLDNRALAMLKIQLAPFVEDANVLTAELTAFMNNTVKVREMFPALDLPDALREVTLQGFVSAATAPVFESHEGHTLAEVFESLGHEPIKWSLPSFANAANGTFATMRRAMDAMLLMAGPTGAVTDVAADDLQRTAAMRQGRLLPRE